MTSASNSERMKIVEPLLENKIKCSQCNRHYVSVKEYNDNYSVAFSYEHVAHLRVTDWIDAHVPEKMTLELRCLCGHGGLYDLSPNPLLVDIFDRALESGD